jgi:hypothetical protein
MVAAEIRRGRIQVVSSFVKGGYTASLASFGAAEVASFGGFFEEIKPVSADRSASRRSLGDGGDSDDGWVANPRGGEETQGRFRRIVKERRREDCVSETQSLILQYTSWFRFCKVLCEEYCPIMRT